MLATALAPVIGYDARRQAGQGRPRAAAGRSASWPSNEGIPADDLDASSIPPG